MITQGVATMSTSQEKMQAFQSAQKFGRQYPGLLEALQDWAAIGSLDQAAEEATIRLDKLHAEEQALKIALEARAAEADSSAKKLVAEAKADLANKRAIGAALVDEAKSESRRIVDAARVKATQLVKDAENQTAEHHSQLATAKVDLAAILSRIEAKSNELASISAAVDEKCAQHEHFSHLIAELKARL
jgi:hypothetical protein